MTGLRRLASDSYYWGWTAPTWVSAWIAFAPSTLAPPCR